MKTSRKHHILYVTVLSALIILTGVSCTRVKAASDTTWVYNAGIGRESRDFHYVVGEGASRKEAEDNALKQIAYEVCGASELYSYDDGKDSIFRFEYSTFLAEDEIASLRKRVRFAEYAKDDDDVYYALAEIAKDDFLRELVYKKLEENGIERGMAVDLTITSEYESCDETNHLYRFVCSSSQTGSVLSSYIKSESDEESEDGLNGISCPDWVWKSGAVTQERYYSVGVAKGLSRQDSVMAAMANARDDIAQSLSLTTTSHYENTSSEMSITSSTVLSDAVLEGVWIDADGSAYVLMSIPVEWNIDSYKEFVENTIQRHGASEEAMDAMDEAIRKYFGTDTENIQTGLEEQNDNENI